MKQAKKEAPARRAGSAKAGLNFPVNRIHCYLKRSHGSKEVCRVSAVFVAATLEYLVTGIVELAGNAAHGNEEHQILPHHLKIAIRNNEELNKLLGHTTVLQSDVLPNIHSELLLKKTNKKSGEVSREF
ncbi:histone-fold-containing protein [Zychaea mexicana]|uniref:histone-fold-containing protein n=1 Tax=Zychaea mexicana TaxID=64656 RepID=UPI0022FF0EBB|nr:histone-fold-containing protein [Zychaea mexicana]KAI9493258.1 histone-fold-containing protein [Zychaea mexicana]